MPLAFVILKPFDTFIERVAKVLLPVLTIIPVVDKSDKEFN